MKKFVSILLLLSVSMLVLSSCLTKLPGVVFTDKGTTIPVLGKKSGDDYTYRLKDPFTVVAPRKSVYLVYISTQDVTAEIPVPEGEPLQITLPGGKGARLHYQLPVKTGFVLSGLTVKGVSGNRDSFTLLSAGMEDTVDGYRFWYMRDGGSGEDMVFLNRGMVQTGEFDFSFKGQFQGFNTRLNQIQIRIAYDYPGEKDSEAVVTLGGIGSRKEHTVTLFKGGSTLYFYSGEEGFLPDSVTVTGEKDALMELKITSLEIKPFSRLVPMNYLPIPADIGVMLNYPSELWRRSDFEIFSWNLFPDFLLIDFKDYALQAAALKRLAFFLEKKGYAGTLLDNRKLALLHGWNAHDYRAEDLALFFNTAAEKSFNLNKEEYELLDILISNGIVKRENDLYKPVSGGFLAYSRESSDRLRYLFITHEGYHGVYFSSPEYRRAVHEVWNSLSDKEKDFWKIFLNWKRYNTEDPYLVVNEFQAYLMQQKIKNIDDYYKNYIIPKLKKSVPALSAKLDSFLEAYPDHFVKSAGKVEEALFRLYGITSGELRSVRD